MTHSRSSLGAGRLCAVLLFAAALNLTGYVPVHAQDVVVAPKDASSPAQKAPAAVITNSLGDAAVDATVAPVTAKSTNNAAPIFDPVPPSKFNPLYSQCKLDTDCSFVSGACGAAMIVNRSYATPAQAVLPKCGLAETPQMAELAASFQRDLQPHCRNNVCVVEKPKAGQDSVAP